MSAEPEAQWTLTKATSQPAVQVLAFLHILSMNLVRPKVHWLSCWLCRCCRYWSEFGMSDTDSNQEQHRLQVLPPPVCLVLPKIIHEQDAVNARGAQCLADGVLFPGLFRFWMEKYSMMNNCSVYLRGSYNSQVLMGLTSPPKHRAKGGKSRAGLK